MPKSNYSGFKDVTNAELEREAQSLGSLLLLNDVPSNRSTTYSLKPILLAKQSAKSASGERVTLWLHCNAKRTCWYFKGLYEYEAFVTTGPNPGDPRYQVNLIELLIWRPIDGANYTHACTNTDYCAKSDEYYSTGSACGQTCLIARATIGSVSWTTDRACVS